MPRCVLDIDNLKFRAGIDDDPALDAGLRELRRKVATDRGLSGWFNHPMPGFPALQNRIWKWDFAPEGEASATRKGWRLYGYVENPEESEPSHVTPFLIYAKPGPKGNLTKYVADAINRFLRKAIKFERVESNFLRKTLPDDQLISLCGVCCEVVAMSYSLEDIEAFEDTHECPVEMDKQSPT